LDIKINKNSIFYWWPKVKDLPIPKPKTITVPLSRTHG